MAGKKKEKASSISKMKKKDYVYVKSQERDSLLLRRGHLGDKLSKLNTSGIKDKKKKSAMQARYDEAKLEYDKCTELADRFTNGGGLSGEEEVSYIIFCLGLQRESLNQSSPCDIVTRNINEVNSLIKGYEDILDSI